MNADVYRSHRGYRRFRPLITAGYRVRYHKPQAASRRITASRSLYFLEQQLLVSSKWRQTIRYGALGTGGKGDSKDVPNGNPTSGASPPEFSPTAILGSDRDLFFGGKLRKSPAVSDGLYFSWRSSSTGSIILGADFHPCDSGALAPGFVRTAMFVKGTNRL
ncbi:unnamed protein product [Macrosiphum euphorbiae]|uniref:Uncharacterized protein n=1 Tax=Macrosiphum euphorbiae TaxID=13131 RepID=A0AAV0X580_9HEMI|nr:unnamed protein product [Macrosiphum euphorbiae]